MKIFTVMLFVITLSCSSAGVVSSAKKSPMRGLYIPNKYAVNLAYIKSIVNRARQYGVNMMVLDAHPFGTHAVRINPEAIAYLKSEGIYIAGRIVCFQDGLSKLPVPDSHMQGIFSAIKSVASAGFDEVQLDYIRFQDGGPWYSLDVKYGFIDSLLKMARDITDAAKVKLSADLFGRVVYNKNDIIGQKVEHFAKYADVIYPMLYPSHFTGDNYRMSRPGETIREGTMHGLDRIRGTNSRIQPYIQAFPYNIQWARVPLDRYILLQIEAAESTEARGWVAWNAKGDYEPVFKALYLIRANKP
jgi:hypothetical protein